MNQRRAQLPGSNVAANLIRTATAAGVKCTLRREKWSR